ncbi:MAG: hypothetical protein ACMG6S_04715 [Byssovorax sp.]
MTSGDALLAVIALLVVLQLLVTRTAKSAARAQQTGRAAPSSGALRLPLPERREPLPAAAKIMMPPPLPAVRVDARRRRRPRAARLTPAQAREGIRWMTILGPCRGRAS